MEALLVLTALVAVFGVVIAPALRRRRLARQQAAKGAQGGAQPVAELASGYGFVPAAELDVRLPGPDPELLEALEETQRGQDWEPVARLLAFTGDEWELRWQRVQSMAGAAALEGGDVPWLRQWRRQRPDDPGAAQVYAQYLVWQAVADPAAAEHRIILEEARSICHDAAALSPADPTPHITELFIARHLAYRHADLEELWSTVRRKAPHHMGAHLAALPYWSEEGCGSREQAYAFARAAAANAPEGTLLPALPLFAVYAHLPEVNVVRGLYRSAEVENAIEAAEFAVDQVEEDHPVRPHVLHLLVWMLVRAERYEEAMEALSVVDGYVGALPWVESGDPAAAYAAYRALAVAGWESTGGSRARMG